MKDGRAAPSATRDEEAALLPSVVAANRSIAVLCVEVAVEVYLT